MSKNIILCGVGGQGTILASRLIATAAMDKNIPIKTAETIGMAQRGGSVFSHLRLGEGTNSPLIGKGEVDLIIGFEPGETVRQLPFLKKGGAVVVSSRPVSAWPDDSISDLTVGLRCSSASVTSERNGSISWFSAGIAECVKIIVRSGSMPAAM